MHVSKTVLHKLALSSVDSILSKYTSSRHSSIWNHWLKVPLTNVIHQGKNNIKITSHKYVCKSRLNLYAFGHLLFNDLCLFSQINVHQKQDCIS